MKNKLFVSLWVLASATAFAGRVSISPADNKFTKPGVISLSAEWVKDKGKKFDLRFSMNNDHDKGIIVLLKEMKCAKGGLQGELKHTFFNTGEKTIQFRAGELKTFTLVCQLGAEAEDKEYKVIVGNVYENPSEDGKTLGKVLAKGVEWKVKVAD